MKACMQDERYCEPMLSWSLRLDTELVKHKEYIQGAQPGFAFAKSSHVPTEECLGFLDASKKPA